MNTLQKIIVVWVMLCFSQLSFAQVLSDTATLQSGPAFEIFSGPTEEGPNSNLLAPATQLAGNGSWSNNAAGPTIYSKNLWYYLKLNPIGSIPTTAKIQSVYYTWSLSYIPFGLTVALCYNSSDGLCVDVTYFQNGVTDYFNGQLANKPLIYSFRVNGSGTLSPPAYGQVDQVIVNYSY